MSADLEAAVARLKRDLDAIAAETSGAKEARGDVRLLLADWERLRTEESGWKEGYDNLRREKWQEEDLRLRGDIRHSEQMNDALEQLRQEEHQRTTAEQERDAARAEVERLKAELTSEREQWAGFVDACAQVGVTWTMRDPTPEHPIGVEIRNAAVTELARLRERDARVSLMLQRGLAGATTQGKRASVRLDWCVHAVKAALALLKETP